MYQEENCKTTECINAPNSSDFELMYNNIQSLVDIISNRVEDFRNINNKLFGEELVSNIESKPPLVSGAVGELFFKLSILQQNAEALMPEVKRLSRLI